MGQKGSPEVGSPVTKTPSATYSSCTQRIHTAVQDGLVQWVGLLPNIGQRKTDGDVYFLSLNNERHKLGFLTRGTPLKGWDQDFWGIGHWGVVAFQTCKGASQLLGQWFSEWATVEPLGSSKALERFHEPWNVLTT